MTLGIAEFYFSFRHNLYSASDITTAITLRSRETGHVVCTERREMLTQFCFKSLSGNEHSESIKLVKHGWMRIGFMWFRTGSVGGIL
jgi:hypothetical protein